MMIPRTGLLACLTLLVLAPAVCMGMDDDQWKALAKEVTPALTDPDSGHRVVAADKLAGANRREACELLVRLLVTGDKLSAAMAREHADLARGIEQVGASSVGKGAQAGPRTDAIRPKALRMRELEGQLSREADARTACVAALAKTTDPEALQWLIEKGLRGPAWSVRAAAAEALGLCADELAREALPVALGGEKDPRVKLAIVRALTARADDVARGAVVLLLADPVWQVRSAALEWIAAAGGKEAIGALIAAQEKESALRLRHDLAAALRQLTGVDFALDAARWREWWSANQASWQAAAPVTREVPPGGPKGVAEIYGLPVESDRIIFLLDVTMSMGDSETAPDDPFATDAERLTGEHPKLEFARLALRRCLKTLEPQVRFNVYFFNETWTRWQPEPVAATPANKQKALLRIAAMAAGGQSNIWDPLEDALDAAGPGWDEKPGDSKVDTIYLITDGSPNPADVFVNSDGILERVAARHWRTRVRIHGIGVGMHDHLTERVAAATGGRYLRR